MSSIASMKPDEAAIQIIGKGCMPSYSADGKEVLCSVPGKGVIRMNIDGTEPRTIDTRGWGAQWSPNGRHIAWVSAGNINLLDVTAGTRRKLLLPEQANLLSQIYWNMGWSPDSTWLAVKTKIRNSGNYGIVVASINTPHQFKVIYDGKNYLNEDLTWAPDNKRVVCSMKIPTASKMKFVSISRETPGVPKLLPGQPTDWVMRDCDWSPDGKQIVFCAEVPPSPSSGP